MTEDDDLKGVSRAFLSMTTGRTKFPWHPLWDDTMLEFPEINGLARWALPSHRVRYRARERSRHVDGVAHFATDVLPMNVVEWGSWRFARMCRAGSVVLISDRKFTDPTFRDAWIEFIRLQDRALMEGYHPGFSVYLTDIVPANRVNHRLSDQQLLFFEISQSGPDDD